MPYGARWMAGLGTKFRLWAPGQSLVTLILDDNEPLPLLPMRDGWHEMGVGRAKPGSRYRFGLADGSSVPDPASRFQPDDVTGPSEVIDPEAYVWGDTAWHGLPWSEAVIYELHIGAFTPEGTFRGAIERLEHLAALGVTAVELMPVADFPGRHGWGYDGVLPFAPNSAYGRPEDMKAFVDAAHGRGIAVVLDVVYNHFGPGGNRLPDYAPPFLTERHKTPWGPAINYDGADSGPVREFFIHNALYWLEEFHLDGLRLDAVHAIKDDSAVDLLRELVERVRSTITDRPIHLLLENEDNVASRIARPDGDARYTAQWNDDVHHALHVAVTQESDGYYADYHGDTDKLGRALAEGFAFQGEVMPYRGSERGESSGDLPPDAFVAFLQNHDQVGNRAFGDRIGAGASSEAVRAASAVLLLLPQIPLLFMGQEWAASTPFPFFSDFSGPLADAVRTGRRAEFARFPQFSDPAVRDTIPDPQAESTFLAAKLRWEEREDAPHRDALEWHRRILHTRRASLIPLIGSIERGGTYRVVGESAVTVRWTAGGGSVLQLDANLKGTAEDGFPEGIGDILWREGEAEGTVLGPWSVRWIITRGSAL